MTDMNLMCSRKKMRQCIIFRKTALSTCFELYEESTNEFLISCVTSASISPMLLFVKLKDCHLRRFEDICCNLNLRHFVARMLPDWLTGLTYTLTGFEGKIICEIKIKPHLLSSTPVSFTAKFQNEEYEEEEEVQAPVTTTSSGTFSLFSCMDVSCFEETQPTTDSNDLAIGNRNNIPTTRKKDLNIYTTLAEASKADKLVHIKSKKPIWNSETKSWMHGFGGRVKMPCENNFIAIQTIPNDNSDKFYKTAFDDQSPDKMCIRHGKVCESIFVLDFRAPASPIVAFAITCAILCR